MKFHNRKETHDDTDTAKSRLFNFNFDLKIKIKIPTYNCPKVISFTMLLYISAFFVSVV